MTADAGTRLQNIDARMHVTDFDDFVHIHIVMTADLRQLVGKGDVHSAESVLHNLGHFSSLNVRDYDFALAEGGIELRHFFADNLVISTDGPIVMQQFIHHVAGDNPLRSVDEINVFSLFRNQYRSYALLNGARRYCGFDYERSTFRSNLQNILYCRYNVAGINLFAEFIVGSRNRYNIGICLEKSGSCKQLNNIEVIKVVRKLRQEKRSGYK